MVCECYGEGGVDLLAFGFFGDLSADVEAFGYGA